MAPTPSSSSGGLRRHLRNTFLAGVFTAVPIAVTLFVIFYIDRQTRVISEKLLGRSLPVVGIVIAIAAIYFSGLVARSLVGRGAVRLIDLVLERVPLLRELYVAWKQIAFTPGGTEGTFSNVVLLPDETGQMHMLGFTSGASVTGDETIICVWVPAAPNPIQGRLYFVKRDRIRRVNLSADEAFKVILSTGNYLPAGLASSN